MRSLRPSLYATLRAAVAVQISYPADLSRLSFLCQRARVHCAHPWTQPFGRLSPCKSSVLTICPSTRATVMLSVAGTRWHKKSCAIIAPPGEKCGLNCPWYKKEGRVTGHIAGNSRKKWPNSLGATHLPKRS